MDVVGHFVTKAPGAVVLSCLVSVPLTHLVSVILYFPRPKPWRALVFGFTGGSRHVVFQLCGWSLWAFSALTILPVWLSYLPLFITKDLPRIPNTHVDVVSGVAAACSFIGELFLLKALLVYEPSPPAAPALLQRRDGAAALHPHPRQPGARCAEAPGTRRWSQAHPKLALALVIAMGGLLAATGALLLMAVDYMPDLPSRVLYCCLSLSCLLIAGSSTYGLGGFLRYGTARPPPPAPCHPRSGSQDAGARSLAARRARSLSAEGAATTRQRQRRRRRSLDATSPPLAPAAPHASSPDLLRGGAGDEDAADAVWQFFQPFSGGTAFVATQAVGWSLFAASAVLIAVLVQQLVAGVVHCLRCWAISAGALMMAAQVLLAVSLLTWRGKGVTPAQQLLNAASGVRGLRALSPAHWRRWCCLVLPVALMYLPVHVFFTAWALSFAFLPFKAAATAWAALLLPYYALTMRGAPHRTGCRAWPSLQSFFLEHLEGSLGWWFGSVRVVYAGGGDDDTGGAEAAATAAPAAASHDPSRKYIFGLQPHGYYPTGAGMLPLMPSFRALFPGVSPVTLTASVMYFPPCIRDVVCWAGFREVCRESFVSALHESGAVLLCPGGQAEMVHTSRIFRAPPQRELVLHARHRGFVRLAVEHGAALVPVLALGEGMQLRNLFDWPRLQQLTYRKFGFPVPYMMGGHWGLTPLPRRVPLMYVVGQPLLPPPLEPGAAVSEEAVEALHKAYIASLVSLFERYKADHPEYRHARVVLEYD